MVSKGERGWGMDKTGVGGQQIQTAIYKIDRQQGPTIYIAQGAQYPIINLNGKEYEKSINIYVKLNHIAIYEKLIQHCKSTVFQLKRRVDSLVLYSRVLVQ